MEPSKTKLVSCSLSSPDLRKRKEEVISELKKWLLYKKELQDGFAYCFPGGDTLLEQLMAFIKSERVCCPFFTFTLKISDNESETWLELTGPEGVKSFINDELGF